MTKLRIGILIAIFVVLGGAVFLEIDEQSRLRADNRSLRQQAEHFSELQAENERLSNLVTQATNSSTASFQSQELVRLRRETAALRGQTNDLGQLRAENGQLRAARTAAAAKSGSQGSGIAGVVPKESWAFAGYADPEAAFQTLTWAMSQGDAKTFLGSLAPDGTGSRDFQGKPEDEVVNRLKQESEKVTGFKITDKNVVSDDEVILTIYASGLDETARFSIRRIGSEWKVVGPVKGEAPPGPK